MRSCFGLYQGSNTQRNGGPEVPMGSILSQVTQQQWQNGDLNQLLPPRPNTQGTPGSPDGHYSGISPGDREDGQAATSQGWNRSPGGQQGA